MTTKEFKIKYPQYSDLYGNELWDKMVETSLSSNDVLQADPNREIEYLPPLVLESGQKIFVEDESKIKWLDSEGNLVRIGEEETIKNNKPVIESFKMIIFNENS